MKQTLTWNHEGNEEEENQRTHCVENGKQTSKGWIVSGNNWKGLFRTEGDGECRLAVYSPPRGVTSVS